MTPPVLAIIGPGEGAPADTLAAAESLGAAAAREGWVVVSGGVADGVMDAASRGARRAGGLVVGILPSSDRTGASPHLSVAVVTGMGQGRNNLVVLSSDAVAVCGMSAGTAAEVALAMRADRPVVLVGADPDTRAFYEHIDRAGRTHFVATADEALERLRMLMPHPA